MHALSKIHKTFMRFLPINTSCLFSIFLNDDIVDIEKPAHTATRRRGDVVTTSLYTSQQRRRYVSNETRLSGTSPSRLSGMSPRRLIGTS